MVFIKLNKLKNLSGNTFAPLKMLYWSQTYRRWSGCRGTQIIYFVNILSFCGPDCFVHVLVRACRVTCPCNVTVTAHLQSVWPTWTSFFWDEMTLCFLKRCGRLLCAAEIDFTWVGDQTAWTDFLIKLNEERGECKIAQWLHFSWI